jgi:hypothetical protein
MKPALPALLFIAIGFAAAAVLRMAWAGRTVHRAPALLAAWALAGVTLIASASFGGPRGFFSALALLPLSALILVGASVRVRDARAAGADRSAPLEPSDRASRIWRGGVRTLVAVVLAGAAAIGCGLAWKAFLPSDAQTQAAAMRLLVPIVWATGMASALSDNRILRPAIALSGIAILTYAAAWLGGMA